MTAAGAPPECCNCLATRAVGHGIATIPSSRSRLSTSTGRSTRLMWANIVWWFIHMIPMVRKLTTYAK